jgi:hypothetical protein
VRPATQRACGKTVQPATAAESAGQSLNRVFEQHRIEYIISKERFRSLPEDEKRLWHSHHYEAKSGELVAPGIPDVAEHAYFSDLLTTYGKTFHTWQYDRDDFPYGIPQLMMGFTADGQANEALIHDRDRKLRLSTARKRQNRAVIPPRRSRPGANFWEGGRTVQTPGGDGLQAVSGFAGHAEAGIAAGCRGRRCGACAAAGIGTSQAASQPTGPPCRRSVKP